jgi:hypothetical protein
VDSSRIFELPPPRRTAPPTRRWGQNCLEGSPPTRS